MSDLNLGSIYALFNFTASFGALWLMQRVTADAGWCSQLALVKLGHRASLTVVAIVMFASAAYTVETNTSPRPVDFAVEAILVMVLCLSAVRHTLAVKQREARASAVR